MSDVQFIASLPEQGAIDVSPDTDLAFTLYAPSGLDLSTLRILVGSDVAYDNGAFFRPRYRGTVQAPTSQYATIRITPRRPFLYDVSATATARVGSTAFPSPVQTVVTFYTRKQPGSLADATLRATVLDAPFTNLPAAEVLRRVLMATVKGPGSPSYTLSMAYRLQSCSLRCLSSLLPFASTAFDAIDAVRAADIGSTDATMTTLIQVLPLWEPVLAEIAKLGANPGTLDLITRAQTSPYPSEIVGAACAAVMLAGQGLLGFPDPGPAPA